MTGKIAIYLRLSKENDLIRDESNSITNQRDLIINFILKDKELRNMEVVEYTDDGFSGKNMERPGMEALLESIRRRSISVLIVKDMSRFSRDYLVLGKYTEQIFPFMGIRFIAINDQYDSDSYEGGIGEIDVAFKAMLYDFYSEDLSQKVKTSIRSRKEQGRFMNVHAPYGYNKDPENRYSLVVEPEGAAVVRRIFGDYISGKSMYQIAKDLNAEGIDAPGEYIRKRDNYDYVFRSEKETPVWTISSIGRILRNEVYVGTAVYNKARMMEVSDAHSVMNDRTEWCRVENMYPAIVSREVFQAAAERRERGMSQFGTGAAPVRHYLTGKVFCGGCGYPMKHDPAKTAGRPKYRCLKRYFLPDSSKCVTSIRDEDLQVILTKLMHEKIKILPELEEIRKKRKEQADKRLREAENHLRSMIKSMDTIRIDQFHAYENFKEGLTDKETYLHQKEMYEEMLIKLQTGIKLQEKSVSGLKEAADTEEMGLKTVDMDPGMYLKQDRNFADLFIKKIAVFADRRVEVEWNFRTTE